VNASYKIATKILSQKETANETESKKGEGNLSILVQVWELRQSTDPPRVALLWREKSVGLEGKDEENLTVERFAK